MIKWMLLLLFFSVFVNAQIVTPNITTFGRQHGIPSLKVLEMATDSSGYLWVVSNLGLHKFNGHRLRTYDELPRTMITDVEVRQDGKVFVALLNEGLAIYNNERDSFDLFLSDQIFQKNVGRAFSIAFGANQEVYVAHSGLGVSEFHLVDGNYEVLLKKKFIHDMCADYTDETHLILAADSLYKYNPELRTLELLVPEKMTQVKSVNGSNLFYSKYDTYEVGHNLQDISVGKDYVDLIAVGINALWSVAGSNIFKVDSKTHNVEVFMEASERISGIHMDKDGRLWLGYENKLHVVDPISQAFHLIKGTEKTFYHRMLSLDNEEIFCIPWGLPEFHILNTSDNSIQKLQYPKSLERLGAAFDAFKVKDQIWISFLKGLAVYDIDSNEFRQITLNSFNEYFLNGKKLQFVAGFENHFYISSIAEGEIFRIDVETLEVDSMFISGRPYMNSMQASGSEVRVLGEDVLYSLNFDSEKVVKVPYTNGEQRIKLNYVEGFVDALDTMWIISDGELYKGMLQEGKMELQKAQMESESLSFNDRMNIHKTKENELLILASSGLRLLNLHDSTIKHLTIEEGLVNVDRRSHTLIHNNEVLIYGDGIVRAKLDDLRKIKQEAPQVDLLSFLVNGQTRGGDSFRSFENDISIHFESLDLSRPLNVQYRYRLGEDKPWQSADYNEKLVYFPSLQPGDYAFQVSAKHKFSEWGPITTRYFVIQNPIWQQAWFLLSSFLILGLAIYFITRYRINEAKKYAQLKSRMAELENEALRAQMNPHFIFNSLNSIKSFIIEHDREIAADYLTNFSELIRLILANSREKYISLEKELYTLKLYMDIEKVRLENKFSYIIENKAKQARIQPLTLQPFIENAIWHGIVHKSGHGLIKIKVERIDRQLVVSIIDDGVGRAISEKIQKNNIKKRSYGILITKERLSNIAGEEHIKIIDLYDENGQASGTKVQIKIPINYE